MNIYVKPVKKVNITAKKSVLVCDVAQISPKNERISRIEIKEIKSDKKCRFLVDIMDIINAITKAFPDSSIINTGESDVIVDYSPKASKPKKFVLFMKVAFVSVLLFAGASTAIMSFHSDAQIANILEKYYEIFFGEKAENPILTALPYSIGLGVGITVFFNHLGMKTITDDPTPIEVEMTAYENQVDDNIIDTLNKGKTGDDK